MNRALQTVANGFGTVLIGLMITVLGVVILFLGACTIGLAEAGVGGGQQPDVEAGLRGLVVIVGGFFVIGASVGLVGRIRCLSTPAEARTAKQCISISVAMDVLGILGTVLNAADDAGGHFLPSYVKLVVVLGWLAAPVLAAIMFLLFARTLAQFIQRPDLAGRTSSVFWLGVSAVLFYGIGTAIIVVTAFVLFVFAVGGGQIGPGGWFRGFGGAVTAAACIGGLLLLVGLIVALVALVHYVRLLTGMISGLRQFAALRGRSDGDSGNGGDYNEYDRDHDDRADRGDDGRESRPLDPSAR
jgi:hypothetical protein